MIAAFDIAFFPKPDGILAQATQITLLVKLNLIPQSKQLFTQSIRNQFLPNQV